MTNNSIPLPKGETLFFTLLLIFSSFWSVAQQQYTFEINPKSGKKEALNFSIVETIDARIFTKNCGFVPNKAGTEMVPAVFAENLESAFNEFLPNIFEFSDADQKVALVVREFHISETTHSVEFGQFSILLDFYLIQNDKYLKLFRFDDFQVTSGFNITKSHCNNLIKTVQEAGKELAASNWMATTENPKAVWESKNDLIKIKHGFSILETTAYKPGIYQSYIEFKNNDPSITEAEIIIKKAKSKDLLSKKEVAFKNLPDGVSQGDLSKKMWGFSDGENIYISNWSIFQEYSYSRLSTLGKYCPFIGKESITSGGRVAGETADKKAYVFDAHKGQAYLLNDQYLSTILQFNSKLLHKYQQERDKKNPNTQIWYAKELNQLISSN